MYSCGPIHSASGDQSGPHEYVRTLQARCLSEKGAPDIGQPESRFLPINNLIG